MLGDNACSLDEKRPRPHAHTQHSASESTGRDPMGHSSQASAHSTRGEHGARLASTPHPEGHKADGDTKTIEFLSAGKQHRIP